MTVRQLSEVSGQPVAALNRYEQGQSLPRTESLRRVVEAMGATMLDLYGAQQGASGNGCRIEDGTLPPDTRTPAPAAAGQPPLEPPVLAQVRELMRIYGLDPASLGGSAPEGE